MDGDLSPEVGLERVTIPTGSEFDSMAWKLKTQEQNLGTVICDERKYLCKVESSSSIVQGYDALIVAAKSCAVLE
jgi:L-cysteine desulfidase